jgi:murein L,D-transpeptidase YcbB/YkuD
VYNMKKLAQQIFCFIFIMLPSFGSSVLENTFSIPETASSDITTFYKKMGGKPVWFFQGTLTKCGHIAVETLKNAAIEGLNPDDYEDAVLTSQHPEKWMEAEILLTERFLQFIDHVRVGRIDPMRISRDIKFHSPKTRPIDLLVDAIQDKPSECNKLRNMGPALPQYNHLKKMLSDYREISKNAEEWPEITTSKALKQGDSQADVRILRQILALHGDLDNDNATSAKFDEEVDEALRQFQKRHTIEPDGIMGTKTKDALNQPIDTIIRKIIINMERLRWLPDELGNKHIIVNIAGYQVQAFEDSEPKLTIPAIVGRPSRRTPLFYAPLKNIVINPSWGVPYNILVHDKIPKIINDPDYVRRSHFTVTDDSGNVVDPYEADWESEGAHYHLRQSPGRHNALGQIKFNIENPYTIFLHGTPDEKLFQKTARAFSSGCIRLKTPVKLAAWVLNNDEKWSSDQIQAGINKGGTQSVNPAANIDVFFTYQTVWLGEDGFTYISDDPYRMDPKMEKVLKPEI